MILLSLSLLALVQVAVPPPRGYVNDFAGVLDSAAIAQMDALIREVRDKTGGEIAVVTLADIGERQASDVALQIGRQWGVGDSAAAGDRRKNLGVVVLLVPLKNHESGTGQIFIATGRGAEGFLTDARAGRIRDAMTPYFAREDYGGGLAAGVDLIAQAFAQEFGVTLTAPELVRPPPAEPESTPHIPVGLIIAVILLIVLSRGRLLWLPFWLMGGGGGRGWSGGGGWGGRSGGGFGGFGGGGGFSGGGAGGRF